MAVHIALLGLALIESLNSVFAIGIVSSLGTEFGGISKKTAFIIMATWSALSFGGYDPIGSYFEGQQNLEFNKEMADYNAALGYEYAEKYAKNNPAWQRQGLVDAGYNPLLAVSSGVASPFSGPVDSSISRAFGDGVSASFDASAFAKDRYANKVAKAESGAAIAEANAAKAAADLDREMDEERLDALRGIGDEEVVDIGGSDPTKNNKPKRVLRGAFLSALERDQYLNSKEHALFEDTINAAHGGSSAFSNIAHGFRAFRESRRRR